MAKAPKSLPLRTEDYKNLEELKRKVNEIIKVLDEIYRIQQSDIEKIESRLDDGGL